MRKVQLETWTTFDKLCLVTAMLKLKNTTNWGAISRHTKQIYDSVNMFIEYGVRSDDWFSQRQCCAQYEIIVKNFGGRKRRKGERQPDNLEFLEIMEQTLKREFTAELEGALLQLREDYLRSKKIVEDLDNDTMEPERFQQLLLEMEGGSAKSRLKTMLDGKNADFESSTHQVVQSASTTAGSSPLLTSLLQSPSPLRPSLPSTSPNISLLLNSSLPIPVSGIAKEVSNVAQHEEVIPSKLLNVKSEDGFKYVVDVLDGSGHTVEQVEENAIKTVNDHSLEKINVENVNDTIGLTQDMPVIVLDSSQAVGEGKAAILDNQSVIINGEQVKLTNETVVIDSSDLSISGETVLIDGSQMKINRIHKDTVVIEAPPLNVCDVPTNIDNDTVIIDDTASSSQTVILGDSAVKICEETPIVGDLGMETNNEVNLDESDNGAIVLEEQPLEIGCNAFILNEKSDQLTKLNSNDLKLNEETSLVSDSDKESKNSKLIINACRTAELEVLYSPTNNLDTTSLTVETISEHKIQESIFSKSDLYSNQFNDKDNSDYENKTSHFPQDIDNIPVAVEFEGTSNNIKDTEEFINFKDVLDDSTPKIICEAQTLHVDDQGDIFKLTSESQLENVELQKNNQLNNDADAAYRLNSTNELENVSSQNYCNKCEGENIDSEKYIEELKLEGELDKEVLGGEIIVRDHERHTNIDVEKEALELGKMHLGNGTAIEEIVLESEDGNNSMTAEIREEEKVENNENVIASKQPEPEIEHLRKGKDLETNWDEHTCEVVVSDASPKHFPHDHDTVLKEERNIFCTAGQENKDLGVFLKKEKELGLSIKEIEEREEQTTEKNKGGKESKKIEENKVMIPTEGEEDYINEKEVNLVDEPNVESDEIAIEGVKVTKGVKTGLIAKTKKEDKFKQIDNTMTGTKEHFEEIMAAEDVNIELKAIIFEEEEVKSKHGLKMGEEYRVNENVNAEKNFITTGYEHIKDGKELEEREIVRTRDEVNTNVTESLFKQDKEQEAVKTSQVTTNKEELTVDEKYKAESKETVEESISRKEFNLNAIGIIIDEGGDLAKNVSCGPEDGEEVKVQTETDTKTNIDSEPGKHIKGVLISHIREETLLQEVNTRQELTIEQETKMEEEPNDSDGTKTIEEADKKCNTIRDSSRKSQVLEKEELIRTEKTMIIKEPNTSDRHNKVEDPKYPRTRSKVQEKEELITMEKPIEMEETNGSDAFKTIDKAEEELNMAKDSKTIGKVDSRSTEKLIVMKDRNSIHETEITEEADKKLNNLKDSSTKVQEQEETITLKEPIKTMDPNATEDTKTDEANKKVILTSGSRTRVNVLEQQELLTIETPIIVQEQNTSHRTEPIQDTDEEVKYIKDVRTRAEVQETRKLITIEKSTIGSIKTIKKTERKVNVVKGSKTRSKVQEKELLTIENPIVIKEQNARDGTKTIEEAEEKINIIKRPRTRSTIQEKEELLTTGNPIIIKPQNAYDKTMTVEEPEENVDTVKGSRTRSKVQEKEESKQKEKPIIMKELNARDGSKIKEEDKVNVVMNSKTQSIVPEEGELITIENPLILKDTNVSDETKAILETEEKVFKGSRTRSKVRERKESMTKEKPRMIQESNASEEIKTLEQVKEKVNIDRGSRLRSNVQEKEKLTTKGKPIIMKEPNASDGTKTIEEKNNIDRSSRTRSKVLEEVEMMKIEEPMIIKGSNISDEPKTLEKAKEKVNYVKGLRTRAKVPDKEESVTKERLIKEPNDSDGSMTIEETKGKVNIIMGTRTRSKVQDKVELMAIERPMNIREPNASDETKTIEKAEEEVNIVKGLRTRANVQEKEELITNEKAFLINESIIKVGSHKKVKGISRERLSSEIVINKDNTNLVGEDKGQKCLKENSKIILDGKKKEITEDKQKEVNDLAEVTKNESRKKGRKLKEEGVKGDDVRDITMDGIRQNEKDKKEVKADEKLPQKQLLESEPIKIKKLRTRELQNLDLESVQVMISSRKNKSLKTVSPISKLDHHSGSKALKVQLNDQDLTTNKVAKGISLILSDPEKDDLQDQVPQLTKEYEKKQNKKTSDGKEHYLDVSGGLPDGDQSILDNSGEDGMALQNIEIGSMKKRDKPGGKAQMKPSNSGRNKTSDRSQMDSSGKSVEKSTEKPQGNIKAKLEKIKKRGRNPKLVNIYSKEPSSMDNEKFLKNWKKNITLLHEQLASHKDAAIVTKPPRKALIPIHQETIYCPMDLPSLKKRLENGEIKTTVEFQRDVILMINNVLMFNPDNSPDFLMALAMSKDYIEQMDVMVQALSDGVLLLGNKTEEEKSSRSQFPTTSNEEHSRKRRATTAHLSEEPRYSKRARNSIS